MPQPETLQEMRNPLQWRTRIHTAMQYVETSLKPLSDAPAGQTDQVSEK